ncbi:hypothetical protein [Sphingobium yanoikuyae]|jgi:hypothetical protein|uniref:hypothetical protein n=1 Tax=Sphingobium yanoikuyae TaxID=13690 RepID=UPI0028A7BECA|nr:hypothetical protein [Sphingobium yanoikuyae]
MAKNETTVADDNFGFDIPVRYDADVAVEGVWSPPVLDEHDQCWGEFKLVMYDGDNPAIKKVQERVKIKNARAVRLKQITVDDLALEVFLEAILLDWKGVKKNGVEVPYSKEVAKQYFSIPAVRKVVFVELLEFAADVRNYGAADKEDIAGN